MHRSNPVGVIRQPSSSGIGGEDGLEFIRSVGGREPQIHKVWSFTKDVITCKFHPFARIDVGDFSGECFHTNFATEIVLRVFIYGQKTINGSVEWLGVPAPFCDTGIAWTENILVPNLCWGDGRGYERWALVNCSIPRFGGRSIPWRGAVPFRPDYVPSSPENARARGCCVRDVRLRENCLARAQTLLRNLYFGGDGRGMGRTAAWMVGLINNSCDEIMLVV